MFKSRWFISIALGLILATSGQAQQQTQRAGEATANQGEPSENQTFGIPVRIIEGREAAEARERRQDEAEQREIKDLIAQQGMNAATQSIEEATRDMRDYALYSTIIVGIGTLLLIWTLRITRQANMAAQAAVDVTRDIGEKQVRAYVSDYDAHVSGFFSNQTPTYHLAFRNTGLSPARKTIYCVAVRATETGGAVKFTGLKLVKAMDISPSGQMPVVEKFKKPITEENFNAFKTGNITIHVGGMVIYKDVFGKTRRTVFRYEIDRNTLSGGKASFVVCAKNNRAT